MKSLASSLASLPAATREKVLASLSDEAALALRWDWQFWARPNQLAPAGAWRYWLLLAGRGFGKTRCGAEYVRARVESGKSGRFALVAPTAADVRDVMVEGESGILACSPPWFKPTYKPSLRRLEWPNGAIATTYSADEPDRLRGPQHDDAWADELAAWRYAEAWDQLMFGLRLGDDPRAVVTTTPRPTPQVKELVADPHTVLTRGSTYENRGNLAPAFLSKIISKYEGTRLGRQELNAEILEDAEGALWRRTMIEALRVRLLPPLRRSVVAIDPAVSTNADSAETGIVLAGVGDCRCKGKPELHGFVIDDLSGLFSPDGWTRRAVGAYQMQRADRIVAEVNNGGALVESVLRTVDRTIAYRAVHASQGKRTRAEPVAALYEQGKVHHIGAFPKLEDQLCSWEPLSGQPSPDRLDALVWALTDLMLGGGSTVTYHFDSGGRRRI